MPDSPKITRLMIDRTTIPARIMIDRTIVRTYENSDQHPVDGQRLARSIEELPPAVQALLDQLFAAMETEAVATLARRDQLEKERTGRLQREEAERAAKAAAAARKAGSP
jgi:hypothetical protein